MSHLKCSAFLSLLGVVLCIVPAPGQTNRQLDKVRSRMVQSVVVEAGVKDERVVAALRAVPRHLFVPTAQQKLAYLDMALPIGHGQTISPPFVVASMTAKLAPKSTDRVLEIGTGSGYQAAVLSHIVKEVYSIEIVRPLGVQAARTLRRLGYKNVKTRIGDGFKGWPEHAPFDKIIVTCSPERVPQALADQLREGGKMIIPLGRRYQQMLFLLTKKNGRMVIEDREPTFFVPMTGRAEQVRQVLSDDGKPILVNGSFETADKSGEPNGWYYVRQAKAATDDKAPQGGRALHLKNETPGLEAQLLQAVGADGRR